MKAGIANYTCFIPILCRRPMPDLPKVLSALHSIKGSEITSKVGTKTAALKVESEKHLQGLGAFSKMDDAVSHAAEKYHVNILYHGCKAKHIN